jgi:hypothetical protein
VPDAVTVHCGLLVPTVQRNHSEEVLGIRSRHTPLVSAVGTIANNINSNTTVTVAAATSSFAAVVVVAFVGLVVLPSAWWQVSH